MLLEQLESSTLIDFPIPASPKWQLMEEPAGCALLLFPVLEELAANGSFIHNDDTVLRIVDTIRHNRQNPDKKRTGMYTTGILAQNGAHKIALFYNSQSLSGENMDRLLNKRHKIEFPMHKPRFICWPMHYTNGGI